MAKVKEDKSRVTLEVDGKQAINQLGKLEMESKQLAIDLKQAKKGTQEYIDTSKKLKDTELRIKAVREQLGLAGMTMTQLSRYQRDLRKEIQNTTTRGTKEYETLRLKLQAVNQTLGQQRAAISQTEQGFTGSIAKMSRAAGAFGLFLGAGAIIQGFRTLVTASSEFEKSISTLSAITGATGEDLNQLEEAARRIGATTTLSAQQAADAFTIIASKKPELLENNAALIATAEAAITLAEAAGIDLPTAADALTNTMNQFGVGAEEANRFINILAAGSKFGAGNIEFLNDAVKRFGPIAASMNISMEESVAIMEVFAEKGLESEKAGTQFRNILLKLGTGADEFNPKVVGMETAIQNLSDANLSAAEKVKLFGVENFLAGEVMIASGARFADLTQKVTGTAVAIEQAKEMTDNFQGDMKGLLSITGDYAITIGRLITDGLRPFVQAITAGLIVLKETPKFIAENKDLFVALGIALVTFNTAQIVSTALMIKDIAVKKAQAIWTGAVTLSQNLLNAAMTANPIGLVIKAVALLTAGFVVLYNRSETVRAGIAGIAEVAVTVWEIIKETFGAITDGFKDVFSGNFADGMKKLGTAFVKSNPVGLALTEGKRLAAAFQKGYADKLASEQEVDGMVSMGGENLIAATVPGVDPTNPTEPTGAGGNGDAVKFATGVEEIFQRTLDKAQQARALTVDDTKLMFDQLTGLGAKFGVDMEALAKERAEEQVFWANYHLQEERKIADAKQMIAQGLSMSLGAAIDFIGNKSGELTAFQKILTIAQIAIDSAAALGKIVPLAAEAAAGTGPAAPFVFAGYIATMAGTVLGAIAKAKNALSSANVPEYDSAGGDKANTGRSRQPKTDKKSFYYGGYTGGDGIGEGDKFGEFAGPVHLNEYVIPSMTVSDPFVADLMPAIEQVRQDNIRGFSSMNKGGMSTAKMEALLVKIAAGIDKFPREITGRWVLTDLDEAQDERSYLESRYRA